MNTKIKMVFIILVVIISVLITYIVILNNTNSVLDDFYNCIVDNSDSKALKDTALYKYYNRNELFDNKICSAKINIQRTFVIHNFCQGVMFVNYDCETFDDKGKHIYGSTNVRSKWYIKKEHGKWIVYDIDEKP